MRFGVSRWTTKQLWFWAHGCRCRGPKILEIPLSMPNYACQTIDCSRKLIERHVDSLSLHDKLVHKLISATASLAHSQVPYIFPCTQNQDAANGRKMHIHTGIPKFQHNNHILNSPRSENERETKNKQKKWAGRFVLCCLAASICATSHKNKNKNTE